MTFDVKDGDGFAPSRRRDEPDAQGQAALLLAESMLHILVENEVLTKGSAIAAIQSAADVKVEVAEATGESHGRMQESLSLLANMKASFEADQKYHVV